MKAKSPAASCPAASGSLCAQRLHAATLVMISAVVLVCLLGAYYWYAQAERRRQVREGYTTQFTDQQIQTYALNKSTAYDSAGVRFFYSAGTTHPLLSESYRQSLIFFYYTILDTPCTTATTSTIDHVSTRLCSNYNIITM